MADGLPNPDLSWFDSIGVLITNATTRMTVLETILEEDGIHGTSILTKLVINKIKESDYGTYRCEARNSVGMPAILNVHINGTSKYFT